VTSIKALCYAPFSAGVELLAIGQNSELWRFDTGPTDIGAAITPAQNPVYYRGKVIIPNNDGTTAGQVLRRDRRLVALAGSPPTCIVRGLLRRPRVPRTHFRERQPDPSSPQPGTRRRVNTSSGYR